MNKSSLRRTSLVAWTLLFFACSPKPVGRSLLNVSYDTTRELYRDVNAAFTNSWAQTHAGEQISIRMAHGPSGKQARSVIDGLRADVVTLAVEPDIDVIERDAKLLPANWKERLPQTSSPYFSTVVFLVRRGNPKAIKGWDDLIKPGIEVVLPNPKTSGVARLIYLAAYAYGLEKQPKSETTAREFVSRLYKNVPILEGASRSALTTFARRGIGDVLLTWENDAWLATKEFGADFETILPTMSILASTVVAWVDKNTARNQSTELARAYLEFLYSDAGQNLVGRHFFRPTNANVARNFAHVKPLRLVTVEAVFGGWKAAQAKHFADGGVFDQIYGGDR